jgi:hypothetical protein
MKKINHTLLNLVIYSLFLVVSLDAIDQSDNNKLGQLSIRNCSPIYLFLLSLVPVTQFSTSKQANSPLAEKGSHFVLHTTTYEMNSYC